MKKRAVEYPIKRTIRFTEKEDAKLGKLLQKSTYCQTLSELIRDMLFKKEITVNTYDASLQEVKLKLARIRNELQAIGVNINQITRYFNSSQDVEAKQAYAEKVVPHYRNVEGKIEELLAILSQLSKRWLPK
ncbi:plasmid mobilization relaxosome protein MobC [Belliella sp. R4-6]|uniref:Plasmid mobilization relaxosome protein MobC n=1 Tax=Belliella alkalica TaxID=1730871 RepID=A0ABS9VD57_9BACT|nr:plasmid mobilization relaxosome protein MobC [Belliella alkalica]MCH7414313.1 plasmid mobilization relaxosome protein MobC [Belliella alkalica]